MLTEKDKIAQFKRDCESVEYHLKAVKLCNDQLMETDVKLSGLGHKGNSNDPKCENSSDPYKDVKLAPIMEKWKIETKRDEHQKSIDRVEETLSMIKNKKDKQMIIDLYVCKEHYRSIVERYSFYDHTALRKHIDAVLSKIFKSVPNGTSKM